MRRHTDPVLDNGAVRLNGAVTDGDEYTRGTAIAEVERRPNASV
jgi:hypothetical protein